MKHIISVLVENKFGVLSRVSGLFSGRGFNIETISIGPTLDPTISQMTIVTTGDERILEQIIKQLNKLIDVIKVTDLAEKEYRRAGDVPHQGQCPDGAPGRGAQDRRYLPCPRGRFLRRKAIPSR